MAKRPKTAIIGRTNAILVTAAFDLIKRGCQIQIIGKDVAKKLKDTIGEVIETRRRCSIEEFKLLLDGWMNQIRTRLDNDTSMNEETKQDLLANGEEMFGCLNVLAENADSLQDVIDKIDKHFVDSSAITDDPDIITLVTGHRAKGDEYDRVIILRPDLYPHPRAKRKEDLDQEDNCFYVSLTRARSILIICNDKRPE